MQNQSRNITFNNLELDPDLPLQIFLRGSVLLLRAIKIIALGLNQKDVFLSYFIVQLEAAR